MFMHYTPSETALENCFSLIIHNMNYALYDIVEDELAFDLTDHKKKKLIGMYSSYFHEKPAKKKSWHHKLQLSLIVQNYNQFHW